MVIDLPALEAIVNDVSDKQKAARKILDSYKALEDETNALLNPPSTEQPAA